jgi:hypothetical protein
VIKLLPLVVIVLVLVGCVGQSSDDQHSKASEFSEAGFEKAMRESGKERELEEARKREAEYLSKSQGGGESQEGPVNAGTQPGN